ncbi:papain-like cysteine peptidase [Methylobacterium sp. J-072]|uniref:DUF1796 family putative cysteine peptidase n=1 Tax=Methylobacterium sp. J-072 TaxID=2836651 RepID=UPI001FBBDFA6|nr:DUF1796 family putative cysteine peptidase [Methylobacterium sp. J-072]MCJ2094465.1 papain-like cysteine peptidase [Methylobacterium sp. J-072]
MTARQASNSVLIAKYNTYKIWLERNFGTKFDGLDRYRQSPGLDADFVSYASLPTAPLDPLEICGVENLMRDRPRSILDQQRRNYIHKVLTSQFDNISNDRLQSINIISLGSDCLPKTLITKWGLRKSRLLGEKTLPFDLVYATPNATAKILADDFAGLLDPEKIVIHEGLNVPWIPSRRFCFNHEGADEFRINNYAALISRYEERIRRFKKMLSNGKPTIFLWNVLNPYTDELELQILSAIHTLKLQTKGSIRVLAVLTCEKTERYAIPSTTRVMPGATLTRISNRSPEGYVFFDPAHYASEAGLRYEQGFLCALRDVIDIETGIEVSIGDDAPGVHSTWEHGIMSNDSGYESDVLESRRSLLKTRK